MRGGRERIEKAELSPLPKDSPFRDSFRETESVFILRHREQPCPTFKYLEYIFHLPMKFDSHI